MLAVERPNGNETYDRNCLCDSDALRNSFAMAMSAMYKAEVPLYGDLVRITRDINIEAAANSNTVYAERLDLERHGAIRLGKPSELHTIRRIFQLIGLYPVNYYDLSGAGLPMHATAFRPIDQKALSKNPFRVFTTLLRPELLSPETRDLAHSLLTKRNIFSIELMNLLNMGETQGGFTPAQGETFIIEALQTFKWQTTAATGLSEYQALQHEHAILADIACFNTAHINHLTPRVLDIDAADKRMREEGLDVKDSIEGPPRRNIPILLRQTSFLALKEGIQFPTSSSSSSSLSSSPSSSSSKLETEFINGSHKARFGEIEQRGAAVTRKGLALYNRLLSHSRSLPTQQGALEKAFANYPGTMAELISQNLIFCVFRCTSLALSSLGHASGLRLSDGEGVQLSWLLRKGMIEAEPLTYEDFLPFSAAGIFRSNLAETLSHSEGGMEGKGKGEDKEGFETALGCAVLDSDELYRNAQSESLERCARVLGVKRIMDDR